MPNITDPTIASAIRLLMAESNARRERLQDELDLADRQHNVISSLHDLLLDAESRNGRPLRSVDSTRHTCTLASPGDCARCADIEQVPS